MWVRYVIGIITIETKNDLIHTACVSELGKRMEKIKREHPSIDVDMDFDYYDKRGGSVTFKLEGDDKALIKKEIKMTFAQKLETKLMKKLVKITSEIKAK